MYLFYDNRKINTNLKFLRVQQKMSIKELSAETDITVSKLTNIENYTFYNKIREYDRLINYFNLEYVDKEVSLSTYKELNIIIQFFIDGDLPVAKEKFNEFQKNYTPNPIDLLDFYLVEVLSNIDNIELYSDIVEAIEYIYNYLTINQQSLIDIIISADKIVKKDIIAAEKIIDRIPNKFFSVPYITFLEGIISINNMKLATAEKKYLDCVNTHFSPDTYRYYKSALYLAIVYFSMKKENSYEKGFKYAKIAYYSNDKYSKVTMSSNAYNYFSSCLRVRDFKAAANVEFPTKLEEIGKRNLSDHVLHIYCLKYLILNDHKTLKSRILPAFNVSSSKTAKYYQKIILNFIENKSYKREKERLNNLYITSGATLQYDYIENHLDNVLNGIKDYVENKNA